MSRVRLLKLLHEASDWFFGLLLVAALAWSVWAVLSAATIIIQVYQ